MKTELSNKGMAQKRRQAEETFALTAMAPEAWLEQAQAMRVAAEPILQSFLGILHTSQTRPGVRLRKLAYTRAYMLLTGLAFENLLKAIAVKRGLLTANPDLTFDQGLNREKGGHSLIGLARSLQIELILAEQEYFQRLEEYLYWAGRYPVPLKLGTYTDSYAARRLSFSMTDPKLGDELFEKLAKLVQSSY